MYIYIYICVSLSLSIYIYIYTYNPIQSGLIWYARLGIHYRGVQSEGGAVDGGSII